MKPLRTCCCLVSLLVGLFVQAAAQTLEAGHRVRISAHELEGERLEAEILRIEEDSLVLERNGVPWAVSRSSITGIEVANGTHRHILEGALVGGLGTGVVLGQDMLRKPGQCSGSGNYGQLCALFLAGAMVAGAAVGGLIGAAIQHDDWVSVSLEAVPAGTLVGQPRQLPLLVSISVRRHLR